MSRLEDPQQTGFQKSKFTVLVEAISDNFLSIILVMIATGSIAFYLGFEPKIPRFWKVAGLAAIVMLPWGYILGGKLADWLFDPPVVYLVDLDARFVEASLYRLPYQAFLDLEVTEGEIDQVSPSLAFAKDVNPNELTAKGTWRGTLSDYELLRALHLIDECRGHLEERAKVGFAFETTGWSILKRGIEETTKIVVQTFQDGTLPDQGESLDEAISDAMERYDVEDKFKQEAEELGSTKEEDSTESIDPDSQAESPEGEAMAVAEAM